MNALVSSALHRKKNHATSRDDEFNSIRELVSSAACILAPVWPLKTFIAVNPLQGLENLPFEQAVREAERYRKINGNCSPGCQLVNREMIKWCSAFFDDGQSTIPMPNRHWGLYRAFAELARFDRRLTGASAARSLLRALPASSAEAICQSLDRLGIPEEKREEFVRQSLAALPGWSGLIKWKENWQNRKEGDKCPATLVDYVAVRLVLTCLLWPDAQVASVRDVPELEFLAGISTAETQYRNALLTQLLPQSKAMVSGVKSRPDAQLVFCIDVRSEPFRRAIESQGSYETLGFAGFFGLPVSVKGYDEDHPHDSCPVLIKPSCEVSERASTSESIRFQRHDRGRKLLRIPVSIYQTLKYNFATPFALVEIFGPWLGLRMLANTFFPSYSSGLRSAARDVLVPKVPTELVLEDIPLAKQTDFAESSLRMMGLVDVLAPIVVLCGHGCSTNNNAYASALACGACGGNPGGMNARILVDILNNPQVRSRLHDRGVVLPDDTLFLAGEHNTTTDELRLFDSPYLARCPRELLGALRSDLEKARIENSITRTLQFGLPALGAVASVRETKRRSEDWAQVRPEWGLARNAAFVVGPRALTQSINLEGRSFLHSYDWKTDPCGTVLATILTAPMVVAQWINCQYLFSTLDNVSYGGGSKITQNVNGKLGIMQGNASDLMHGLPLQSVFAGDDDPYHEPLRLQTFVVSPRSTIDAIVGSQDVLRKLFGNGWVNLVCIDPEDDHAFLLKRDLTWERLF